MEFIRSRRRFIVDGIDVLTEIVKHLSGGAMWNNKMYNILVYHRPAHQQDPTSPAAELHFKKIKRQK